MCSLLTSPIPPVPLRYARAMCEMPLSRVGGCSGEVEDRTMATFLLFMKDGNVFDPNEIQAISTAFDDVCKSLNLHDGL
jgi:hypothetical protein